MRFDWTMIQFWLMALALYVGCLAMTALWHRVILPRSDWAVRWHYFRPPHRRILGQNWWLPLVIFPVGGLIYEFLNPILARLIAGQ